MDPEIDHGSVAGSINIPNYSGEPTIYNFETFFSKSRIAPNITSRSDGLEEASVFHSPQSFQSGVSTSRVGDLERVEQQSAPDRATANENVEDRRTSVTDPIIIARGRVGRYDDNVEVIEDESSRRIMEHSEAGFSGGQHFDHPRMFQSNARDVRRPHNVPVGIRGAAIQRRPYRRRTVGDARTKQLDSMRRYVNKLHKNYGRLLFNRRTIPKKAKYYLAATLLSLVDRVLALSIAEVQKSGGNDKIEENHVIMAMYGQPELRYLLRNVLILRNIH